MRLQTAVTSTVVILPVFILFYAFKLSGSILILIYVGILTMQPGFARNFQSGKAMIIGNLFGGLISILVYNVLVVVPEWSFLLLVIFTIGLLLGNEFFKGKKLSPLFNMAFSTLLLIIGSVTTTTLDIDASQKVFERIVQLTIAVSYVVLVFGFIEKWKESGRIIKHTNS
jgi:hypothetical protein